MRCHKPAAKTHCLAGQKEKSYFFSLVPRYLLCTYHSSLYLYIHMWRLRWWWWSWWGKEKNQKRAQVHIHQTTTCERRNKEKEIHFIKWNAVISILLDAHTYVYSFHFLFFLLLFSCFSLLPYFFMISPFFLSVDTYDWTMKAKHWKTCKHQQLITTIISITTLYVDHYISWGTNKWTVCIFHVCKWNQES